MNKIDYGIDAPKVIRNLFIFGILCILFVILIPLLNISATQSALQSFIWTGVSLILAGTFMILYSKFGKFRHRDRILNLIKWRGDEKILDIGTGLGLLMIGAAKRLTTGKSFGIDIFQSKDLSNNSVARLKLNIELENVSSKVEIVKENIIKTNFANDFFDVIVSNLCLHNIPSSEDRKAACAEIFRIVKPGGTVIISDYTNVSEYISNFKNLGMEVHKEGTYFLDTFPPLKIIKARKG